MKRKLSEALLIKELKPTLNRQEKSIPLKLFNIFMNLIQYLYPLVYNHFNFVLFLVVTIVITILDFINFLMLFTVSNKHFDKDFWNVKSKY